MLASIALLAGLTWQTVSADVTNHVRAGLEAQKQGRFSDAILEFKKVTELVPDLDAAFVNLGAAYLQDHQYAAAIPALKRSLVLNPKLPGARQMLGYALLAQGYAAESIPYLENTPSLDALGIAQLKTGKLPAAIASLNAALAQRPNDPELLYYLGRASGLLSKEAFDSLESTFPDSARAHQAIAENEAALRRVPEAGKEYATALRLQPSAPGIHLALGLLYAAASDWAQAEEQFRAEANLQPGDAEPAYRLGNALLQLGKIEEARTWLQKADTLLPQMPETLYALGKANSLRGNSALAEKAWTQVIAIEPNSALAAQAYFGLAGLYRKQGKTQAAEREMQLYRELQNRTPPQTTPQTK